MRERLPDVSDSRDRVRCAVRALGVDVHQTQLTRAEGALELSVAVEALGAEPDLFRSPEGLLWLPDVFATEAEPDRLETHRLEGDVAGIDDQVRPGDLQAVLLLDRPQQSASLVEVGVVGPTVQRANR